MKIARAVLTSAFAWAQSWLAYQVKRDGYRKAYLFHQRRSTILSARMQDALEQADDYHSWKNVIPTFLEESPAQEMPSKYLSFVGVTAGVLIGTATGLIAGLLI